MLANRVISNRIAKLLVVALLMAVAAASLPIAPAHAAMLTVTKTADTNDGTCDADCSLREAIAAQARAIRSNSIASPGRSCWARSW